MLLLNAFIAAPVPVVPVILMVELKAPVPVTFKLANAG